jgi:chromate transport protein ChrA
MKLCFCRFLLAAAILVIALFFWQASWAKIALIIAAGLLAFLSLFFNVCCCRMKKEAKVEPPPAPPVAPAAPEEPKVEE